jgi:hypothetical protein
MDHSYSGQAQAAFDLHLSYESICKGFSAEFPTRGNSELGWLC